MKELDDNKISKQLSKSLIINKNTKINFREEDIREFLYQDREINLIEENEAKKQIEINCWNCQNFKISWDKNFPYECPRLGFKSQVWPCQRASIAWMSQSKMPALSLSARLSSWAASR